MEAGAYAPAVAGTYTIQYSGVVTGTVEVVGGSSVLVALPPGTYVLTSLDPPVNATVSISPNPVTVVVEGHPSAAVGVTVTNSFDSPVGYVEIGKVEAGAYAPAVAGTYTIQYSGVVTGTVEVVGGSSVLVALPPGTYVLTEFGSAGECDGVDFAESGDGG